MTNAPFTSIAEIKAANAKLGKFWFTPETMRFFDSRIESDVLFGRYFVTSEKPPNGPRKYTVRCASDDGNISTIGKFCNYPTRQAARRFLGLYLKDSRHGDHQED